jgi:hypothetical protein
MLMKPVRGLLSRSVAPRGTSGSVIRTGGRSSRVEGPYRGAQRGCVRHRTWRALGGRGIYGDQVGWYYLLFRWEGPVWLAMIAVSVCACAAAVAALYIAGVIDRSRDGISDF